MMEEEKWTLVIVPKTGFFKLDLGELWRYRDLLVMYIRRDIVTFYKQTILTRVRDKDCVKNRVKRAKIVRFTLC